MSQTAANALKIRLRDALGEPPGAFKADAFGDFVREEVPRDQFDWDKRDAKLKHPDQVWGVIQWAEEYGGMKLVLWLAEKAVTRRPERDDLKQLVADLRVLVDGTALPKPLADMLALAQAQGTTTWALTVQLRDALAGEAYREYDLPGRFHLSDAVEERLLAILALEASPNPLYVRWLAERVAVEPPLLATLAAKALVAAARLFDRPTLKRLGVAIDTAKGQLKAMKYDADQPSGVPIPVHLRAREYQLGVADGLVDIRDGVGLDKLPPDDATTFLRALLGAFKPNEFAALCGKDLGGCHRVAAHASDPHELVVVSVLVQLRNMGYVPNLIWAAFEAKPLDGTLKDIRDRFGGKEKPQPI